MVVKPIHCHERENVYQAFDRAKRSGALPADAQLFPLKVGVPEPEAPPGFVTVARILIRPRELFAVGVPQASASTGSGRDVAIPPPPSGNTP
jgi:hypothetical protein